MDKIKRVWADLPMKAKVGIVMVIVFLVLVGMMGAYS